MNPFTQDPELYEDQAVLGLLLEHHPAHLSREELDRELGWPKARVADALRRLAAVGLVHTSGEFAFATRAAVRFDELAI